MCKPVIPKKVAPKKRLAPFVRERGHVLVVDEVQPLGKVQSDERGSSGDRS